MGISDRLSKANNRGTKDEFAHSLLFILKMNESLTRDNMRVRNY